MLKHLAFSLIIIISLNSFSQSDSSFIFSKYNSSVLITAFGTGILGSIGYDKIIQENKSSYISGRLSLAIYPHQRIGYTISEYIGKENHHLVLGIGYNILKYNAFDVYHPVTYKTALLFYPNIDVGYSYWNPLHRLSYTILVNPFTIWNGSFIMDIWGGVTLAYHFKNKTQLSNPDNAGQNQTSFLVAGNESYIGVGALSMANVASSPSISLNSNIYLKYYISKIFIKLFAGTSYLNTHKIGSTEAYQIYDNNPYFLNLGLGAGATVYSGSNVKIESGINLGNYFSENKMQLKPLSDPLNLNDNNSYYLTKLNYSKNWIHRPFSIAPEVSVYRVLSKRIELGLTMKYSFNNYQFAGRYYSFDWYYFKLRSNQFNFGISIQYRLSQEK